MVVSVTMGWFQRFRAWTRRRRLKVLVWRNNAQEARWRAAHGGQPVPLTPEERRLMKEMRAGPGRASWEELKALGLRDPFDLDDEPSGDAGR